MDLSKRFWAKVDRCGPDQCWPWMGARAGRRYGAFQVGKRALRSAHRISYELTRGTIPDGMFVCHHCDNPICVNPNHLFLGTPRDNMVDMIRKGRNVPAGTPGEQHRCAKLTNADVREIRSRYAGGGITVRALAREFGVDHSQIVRAVNRSQWSHI